MSSFIRRHKAAVAGAGVAGIGVVVFGLLWFQPWKVVVEKTVDETPVPMAAQRTDEPGATDAGPSIVGRGTFRGLDHETTGTASLVRLADGGHVLRFENLSTSNGPDLRVYLSAEPASGEGRAFARDFIDIGALKGNRGNQNYEIPAGTDVSRFRSVVIWCRRFTVGFGVAGLEA